MSTSPKPDAWAKAWADSYPAPEAPKPGRRARLRARFGRGPWLLGSALVFAALLAPAFAIAQGGGSQTFSSSGRYTVIARNSGSGGATAQTCNTAAGAQACENNVNFGTNYAATYRTTGPTAAYFQTSGSGQATPFVISPNATGMVQYLNANMVGGLAADQLFSNYSQQQSTSSSATVGLSQTVTATVDCPTGTAVLAANGAVSQTANTANGQAVIQSVQPSGTGAAKVTAIVVGPSGNSNSTFTLTAYATCAAV